MISQLNSSLSNKELHDPRSYMLNIQILYCESNLILQGSTCNLLKGGYNRKLISFHLEDISSLKPVSIYWAIANQKYLDITQLITIAWFEWDELLIKVYMQEDDYIIFVHCPHLS